ncbi:hypothetical protein A11A3_14807 [Alcanivorax hongdengensis A-11-3]|uniref:Uncharacterized protein n=1 Tax=Alcanivorax hongdengensis A-11-3 TaxID=1177179 RepID=L0WBW2_9GAMM|nr:hypothetical protein A11A3_14807 [Alcanivorax hongdengensis A-11-3]
MNETGEFARLGGKGVPSGFRQPEFIRCKPVSMYDVETSQNASLANVDLYPALGIESFRVADVAIIAHIDHQLLMAIDTQSARFQ